MPLHVRLEEHCLLESLLYRPDGGFWLLDHHLHRLVRSASFFSLPLNVEAVRCCLDQLASELDAPAKVRCLVDSEGQPRAEAVSLSRGAGAIPEPVRVGLAAEPVQSTNPWLCHKTTNRAVYEAARQSRPDVDDVLLHNERHELTEASSSNLVVVFAGRKWTPPEDAGLLPGTFRRFLLDAGEIEPRPIRVDELAAAEQIYLINSVRKWRRATFVG
jgi:para-aminobenzoate synthetase/4-amino-4-deoxychorismate lyase